MKLKIGQNKRRKLYKISFFIIDNNALSLYLVLDKATDRILYYYKIGEPDRIYKFKLKNNLAIAHRLSF